MPITRSPSTRWTASVTIPAGFVKFTSHAPGACAASSPPARHLRDRAQREADAARAGGLLPEHAERERHRLVDHPALEPPDADRAEHEVGALDRVVEVGRDRNGSVRAALVGEALEHGAHALEAAGVDVVQHDLVERERLARGAAAPP